MCHLQSSFPACLEDGIGLCALVNTLVPESCPRADVLDPDQRLRNLKLALYLVEKHLNIKPALSAEEILSGGKPTEKNLIILLAQIKMASEKQNLFQSPYAPKPTEHPSNRSFDSHPTCLAKGMGLMLAVQGRKSCFHVLIQSTEFLDVVIEIRGPKNTACIKRIANARSLSRGDCLDVARKIDKVEEDFGRKEIPLTYQMIGRKISIGYTPLESGKHHLSIIWQGQHIKGSPYVINVDKSIDILNNEDWYSRKSQTNFLLPPGILNDENDPSSATKRRGRVIRKKILRYIVKIGGNDVVIDDPDKLCEVINSLKEIQNEKDKKSHDSNGPIAGESLSGSQSQQLTLEENVSKEKQCLPLQKAELKQTSTFIDWYQELEVLNQSKESKVVEVNEKELKDETFQLQDKPDEHIIPENYGDLINYHSQIRKSNSIDYNEETKLAFFKSMTSVEILPNVEQSNQSTSDENHSFSDANYVKQKNTDIEFSSTLSKSNANFCFRHNTGENILDVKNLLQKDILNVTTETENKATSNSVLSSNIEKQCGQYLGNSETQEPITNTEKSTIAQTSETCRNKAVFNADKIIQNEFQAHDLLNMEDNNSLKNDVEHMKKDSTLKPEEAISKHKKLSLPKVHIKSVMKTANAKDSKEGLEDRHSSTNLKDEMHKSYEKIHDFRTYHDLFECDHSFPFYNESEQELHSSTSDSDFQDKAFKSLSEDDPVICLLQKTKESLDTLLTTSDNIILQNSRATGDVYLEDVSHDLTNNDRSHSSEIEEMTFEVHRNAGDVNQGHGKKTSWSDKKWLPCIRESSTESLADSDEFLDSKVVEINVKDQKICEAVNSVTVIGMPTQHSTTNPYTNVKKHKCDSKLVIESDEKFPTFNIEVDTSNIETFNEITEHDRVDKNKNMKKKLSNNEIDEKQKIIESSFKVIVDLGDMIQNLKTQVNKEIIDATDEINEQKLMYMDMDYENEIDRQDIKERYLERTQLSLADEMGDSKNEKKVVKDHSPIPMTRTNIPNLNGSKAFIQNFTTEVENENAEGKESLNRISGKPIVVTNILHKDKVMNKQHCTVPNVNPRKEVGVLFSINSAKDLDLQTQFTENSSYRFNSKNTLIDDLDNQKFTDDSNKGFSKGRVKEDLDLNKLKSSNGTNLDDPNESSAATLVPIDLFYATPYSPKQSEAKFHPVFNFNFNDKEKNLKATSMKPVNEPPSFDQVLDASSQSAADSNYSNMVFIDNFALNELKVIQSPSVKKVIEIFQHEKEEPIDKWPGAENKCRISPSTSRNGFGGKHFENPTNLELQTNNVMDSFRAEESDEDKKLVSIKDRVKLFEKENTTKSLKLKAKNIETESSAGFTKPTLTVLDKKRYWENFGEK